MEHTVVRVCGIDKVRVISSIRSRLRVWGITVRTSVDPVAFIQGEARMGLDLERTLAISIHCKFRSTR
jgi:hypothetical protein